MPFNLYHIQWKFRDEVRPRFGIMRGREFLMKDAYSFDLTKEAAKVSYNKMFLAYLRTFARMGLKAIPMRADTGPIGGDLSHEFIILAETGESEVFYHRDWQDLDVLSAELGYGDDLEPMFQRLTSTYAATSEMHDPIKGSGPDILSARGIEVGHIFYFGTKYSKPLGAVVAGPGGESIPIEMGSYGIGVSRLVGAIIEASHDEAGIIWPEAVAPFRVALVNMKKGDAACDAKCDELYATLSKAGVEVLYDDRDERAGVKLADMDLIGIPWRLVVGPRGVAAGTVELKQRNSADKHELSTEAALARLIG
jgi:prolyl-tRNA synthetase